MTTGGVDGGEYVSVICPNLDQANAKEHQANLFGNASHNVDDTYTK